MCSMNKYTGLVQNWQRTPPPSFSIYLEKPSDPRIMKDFGHNSNVYLFMNSLNAINELLKLHVHEILGRQF